MKRRLLVRDAALYGDEKRRRLRLASVRRSDVVIPPDTESQSALFPGGNPAGYSVDGSVPGVVIVQRKPGSGAPKLPPIFREAGAGKGESLIKRYDAGEVVDRLLAPF
eukprot:Hpha_TRINITY_DN6345_c0_g2::TRINITY_DN6345_c0_g2_i1::g.145563::m.145563